MRRETTRGSIGTASIASASIAIAFASVTWSVAYRPAAGSALEHELPFTVTPGTGDDPPSDALVLIGEGADLSAWVGNTSGDDGWTIEDGIATVGKGSLTTREKFGDIQLHMEWKTPGRAAAPTGSQDRGNSGIKIHEAYEIQVLDSHGVEEPHKGQAGSVYAQTPPLVNASRPSGEWQEYDIIFRAPYWDDDGELVKHGTVTVFHNGVLVQDHTKILGRTNSDRPVSPDYEQPFFLQDHGSKVQYRNLWVRRLEREPLGDD